MSAFPMQIDAKHTRDSVKLENGSTASSPKERERERERELSATCDPNLTFPVIISLRLSRS